MPIYKNIFFLNLAINLLFKALRENIKTPEKIYFMLNYAFALMLYFIHL